MLSWKLGSCRNLSGHSLQQNFRIQRRDTFKFFFLARRHLISYFSNYLTQVEAFLQLDQVCQSVIIVCFTARSVVNNGVSNPLAKNRVGGYAPWYPPSTKEPRGCQVRRTQIPPLKFIPPLFFRGGGKGQREQVRSKYFFYPQGKLCAHANSWTILFNGLSVL